MGYAPGHPSKLALWVMWTGFALILIMSVSLVLISVSYGAEPMKSDPALELLNERRARIDAEIRVRDLEIQKLVKEYQEVMNQINTISPPKAKSDVARPLPGEKPPPPPLKQPPEVKRPTTKGFQKDIPETKEPALK